MKNWIILIFCLLAAGCVTLESEYATSKPLEDVSGSMERRFLSLRQVHTGMSPQEVESVLGAEIVTGYELVDTGRYKQYKPVTVQNPQKTENIVKGNRNYQVDYYLIGIATPDGNISQDEMMPLVFLNEKLIGSGWAFLNEKIRN